MYRSSGSRTMKPRTWTSRSSRMLSRPTWIRSARSGSSLIAKMPAVRARDEPVVQGQLVREVAALGDLDRVDLADQVGDGDVRGRELLAVAPVAREPVDGGLFAALGSTIARAAALTGCGRVVIELPAGDDRQPRVEESDEQSRQPRLGLAALAEEDQVVPGQDRVLDRGNDRILVADDAREGRRARRPRGRGGSTAAPP